MISILVEIRKRQGPRGRRDDRDPPGYTGMLIPLGHMRCRIYDSYSITSLHNLYLFLSCYLIPRPYMTVSLLF